MKHHAFIISLFAIYMTTMTGVMLILGIGIGFDNYALVLLLGAALIGKAKSFVLDWSPFLFILISYEFLRGLADKLNTRVNFTPQLNADLVVFGQVPSVALQNLFFNIASLSWFDYFATIIYFLHFVPPLSFACILWLYKKQYFREFIIGISLLSYGAWATYLAFPAAPPWMANRDGYISGLTRVMDLTIKTFPERLQLPSVYAFFAPNPVAAVPSLHAAYPFLIFLFALKFFKRKAWLFFPYVFAVWLTIVYLGEHYVSDIFVGVLYAFIAFFATGKIFSLAKKIQSNRLSKN